MIRTFLIIALLLFQISDLKSQVSDLQSPLGFPATVTDLYIPGPPVEVVPRRDNESSLVIRILESKPAADGFRYDLEIYALDPGTHRIADFLRRTNTQAPVEDLNATFTGTTTHPLNQLPQPAAPDPVLPEKLGGYRTLLISLGILWCLILLVILFYRKKLPKDTEAAGPPPTLQEKLQALVTRAATGELPDADRARLERLILGHWKQKLPHLADLPPSRALVELRHHPEAAPLVLKLEEWLHAPNQQVSPDDLTALLSPYLPESQI